MRIRAFLALFAAVVLGALVPASRAQDAYSARPVTVIVTFAACGNADTLAPIFAERM